MAHVKSMKDDDEKGVVLEAEEPHSLCRCFLAHLRGVVTHAVHVHVYVYLYLCV